LQVVDSACDRANEMVLQTIALPLGDRATGVRNLAAKSGEKCSPPAPTLYCTWKPLVGNFPFPLEMVFSWPFPVASLKRKLRFIARLVAGGAGPAPTGDGGAD
jgi:hypothetical protein